MKSISKSFRLSPDIAKLIETTAKANSITQTDVISKLVLGNVADNGKRIANISQMANGGNTEVDENSEVYQKLKALGIGTPSGFAGYHVSEWIKKQIEKDNKKGKEILCGMMVGLTDYYVKNTK